jgi:hypothetical protein
MGRACISGLRICRHLVGLGCLSFLLGQFVYPAGRNSHGFSQAVVVPICQIQGNGSESSFTGQILRTRGVVFADLDQTAERGFFMQEELCDANSSTSDGIFVYIGDRVDIVNPGDRVEVTGQVQEYFGMTEIKSSPELVTIISGGNALPVPVILNPPSESALSRPYLESLEGMHVKMESARVVGPTNERDETWVVNAEKGLSRIFGNTTGGTGAVVCVDDGGLYEITPEANAGETVNNLSGFVEYSYGIYRLQLLQPPEIIPGSPIFQPDSFPCGLTVATFNLRNMFDPDDDPEKQDPVLTGAEYLRRLSKTALAIHVGLGEPSLIAVQEAENSRVLEDLLIREEIETHYGFVLEEGFDERGINLALLYRKDRARMLAVEQSQGCTDLIDGLGPDGNGDVDNPQNAITCDSDDDGIIDGNRLFSRPPLTLHLSIFPDSCLESMNVWLIVNHWKSKSEDEVGFEFTLARRNEQAAFVADLYHNLTKPDPSAKVILLGDLNDVPGSQPLEVLRQTGLKNISDDIPQGDRYTYIFHGVSQLIDHILISESLENQVIAAVPLHFNADYAEEYSREGTNLLRSSDHDPLLAWFGNLDNQAFLPLVARR